MIAIITIVCAWLFGWSRLTVGLLMPSLYLLDTGFLWVHYLAIMRLQQVRNADKLPAETLWLAKAVLYLGLMVDLSYNWTWAIVVYFDVPRELLVTQRLERYKYGRAYSLRRAASWDWKQPSTWLQTVEVQVSPATGWRLARTDWYATNMLDPFDPTGTHLRPPQQP